MGHQHFQCFLFLIVYFPFLNLVHAGRTVSSADIETLQLAHVIFRHGSRSPLTSYNNDPYNNTLYWPDGLGQLTAKGKQQEYELGRYLQWRYTNFIGTSYKPSEVYAKSSDIDRAIMSGELVLAGLYPPSPESSSSQWSSSINWQPIPIHTVSPDEDNKIAFSMRCPRYEKLFYSLLNTAWFKEIDSQNEYMFSYLSEYSKNNISNIMTAADLYDVFYVQEFHDLEIPEWGKRYYPEKLREATTMLWDLVVKEEQLKRLRGGPLLGEIMLNMDRVVQGETRRKYPNPKAKLYLYSGHDSTVATILGTLKVFDPQIPPYSSAVIIELHRERTDDSGGNYFVEVYYRNDTSKPPFKLSMPDCGDPCMLDVFVTLYKDYMIYDKATWMEECQTSLTFMTTAATEAFFAGMDFVGVLMMAALFVLGIATASCVFLFCIMPHYKRALRKKTSIGTDDCPSKSSASSHPRSSTLTSIANNNYRHVIKNP